jgi:hypothetical protein
MTFQDILTPIEDFMVWTFETLLEPIGNAPNTVIAIAGFIGILIWLKKQKDYNAKAEREDTIK